MFPPKTNFICQQIDAELAAGRRDQVVTRFPPEPNGYLHIGHIKSIALNFGVAEQYGGQCILRFDDTNPLKEDAEFAAAIKEDVRWLGYAAPRVTYASDYFAQLYDCAVTLIKKNLAYVDRQSPAEIRCQRGTLTAPGEPSRDRDRAIADNLDLFARMRRGEFADGAMVLRAKIDMAAPNLNLRDPVLYRIRRQPHQRSGDAWNIYPLYDFAHGQCDALEGVTHSLCTMEFEDHRALYEWFLDALELPQQPRQIEFSRLNVSHTVLSKRLLAHLVERGAVDGWDDPRMPTIRGLRRRGVSPAALRRFVASVGVTRSENCVDLAALENCLREELAARAPRAMAVLNPLKVVLENYPAAKTETIEAPNHPQDASFGRRRITLSRELYIERDDFMDDPPKKFFRLKPGGEVRLRYAFVIKCTEVRRDACGAPVELRCEYDPATRAGAAPAGRKVKGIIHWVNAADALPAEVRLYDRLFKTARPRAAATAESLAELRAQLNPASLVVCAHARLEAGLANAAPTARYQFERRGYFCLDGRYNDGAAADKLVFNRIVALRDSWAKADRRAPSFSATS